MSLLLEALKKAERAKEEAQRRAKEGAAEAGLDPDATVAEGGKRVLTRDELPDISQPLEILSEDLQRVEPPATPAAPAEATSAPAPEPRAAPKTVARAAEPTGAQAAAARAKAQKVFEAKFKEPNPRLPFYVAMGALGVLALGTVGYFWYQLRPPPALVNANPPRPAGESPVTPTETKVAAAPAAAQAAAPSAEPEVPGLPSAPGAPAPTAPSAPTAQTAAPAPSAAAPATSAAKPAPAPPAAAVQTPKSAPPPAPASPSAAPAVAAREAKPAVAALKRAPQAGKPEAAPARAAPARTLPREERALRVRGAAAQIHPRVEAGYGAFLGGDLALARTAYEQALRDEPDNRDALLGLAAVETRAQRFEAAERLYQRLLRIDPRDPHAHAGMLALRGPQIDPVVAESRVKTLLAVDPEQSVLHFTLGNQYAQQERWAEAQQAYFKAHAADPDNPDYAFNLAVSLDQLRQPKLALEYYRRALALAEKRAPNFSPEAARARLQELSR
jgi:tetratricopeptide (TPR) repeat protein